MLFSIPSWRLVLPLGGVGLILLLISLFLVGLDVAFARQEAEREVVAFAEAGALALQFTPTSQVDSYLAGLLKHPAIATATVYSSNGARTTSSRRPGTESPFIKRFIPTLKEPVVGCRVVGSASLCLEADMAYYHQRLAALLLPHGILLAASWLLLMMALVLGAGSSRRRLAQLSQLIKRAIDENNYSLRALEGKGQAGDVSRGVNRLLEQMHQRDLILRRRSTELETANRELEAFAYSVSHDLRSPLASVEGFSHALSDAYGDVLDDSGKEYLRWIRDAVTQMTNLVAGLLQMSRLSRMEINRTRVDLSAMAHSVAESLRQTDPTRSVEFRIEPRLAGGGDEQLLHAVL